MVTISYTRDDEELTIIFEGENQHVFSLIGDFEDELDCELSAIDEADRLELISREEKRELQRKAYKREEMRERGRQRWKNTTPEERKKHSQMMNRKQGK